MGVYAILSLFLFSLVTASFCPTYTCDSSLAANVCASRQAPNSSIKLNSNGCQTDYYCFGYELHLWGRLDELRGSPAITFPCFQINKDSTSTQAFTGIRCPTPSPGKRFKSGQSIVSCTSDNDCLLADNTYTDCECPFRTDGNGICRADQFNDQVFSGFYKDCGADNMITDEAAWNYWSRYWVLWAMLQNTVSCVDIFYDIAELNGFYAAYQAANPDAVTDSGGEANGSAAMSFLPLLALF